MSNVITRIYRNRNTSTASLLLRLLIGVLFAYSGWEKLGDMAGTIKGFAALGIGPSLTVFTSWVELVAGVLIILGILIKPSAVAIAVIMAVAMFIVPPQAHSLYFGHDYQFVLLVASIALYFNGAGRYSLLQIFRSRHGRQG